MGRLAIIWHTPHCPETAPEADVSLSCGRRETLEFTMDRAFLTKTVLEVVRAQAAGFSGPIREDTPLGPDGLGIDSIGCLDIVLELEQRTGITLRDETLTAESLVTPGSLVEHLVSAAGQ
jgi:acyl carrier protein